MSLAANETLRQGLVVDRTTGALSVVFYTTSSQIVSESGGLPRDADGRLVVIAV